MMKLDGKSFDSGGCHGEIWQKRHESMLLDAAYSYREVIWRARGHRMHALELDLHGLTTSWLTWISPITPTRTEEEELT